MEITKEFDLLKRTSGLLIQISILSDLVRTKYFDLLGRSYKFPVCLTCGGNLS